MEVSFASLTCTSQRKVLMERPFRDEGTLDRPTRQKKSHFVSDCYVAAFGLR